MPRLGSIGKRAVTLVDAALVIAALGVGGLLLQSRLAGRSQIGEVVRVPEGVLWQRALENGHIAGSQSADLRFVVFADFQCPVCAYMHSAVDSLLQEFDGRLAIVYRHFPLANHASAVDAALAAECAASQDRFKAFSDVLYERQQWIGVDEWVEFARAADVTSLGDFERCVRHRDMLDRVKSDMTIGRELGVRATPTFLVDGSLLVGVPSTRLEREVREALERIDRSQRSR